MNDKIMLSPHFSLEEMTRSATAERLSIDNTPNEQQVNNLRFMCHTVLEPLRAAMGTPIYINSAYRSEKLNMRLHNAAWNSMHLQGLAVDIRIKDVETGRKYFRWLINNLDLDQVLFEFNKRTHSMWLHVSNRRSGNRHQYFPNYIVK